ncbi:hypothetical protein M5X11_06015, partial [Paenibacillus alginolyticus]|uniref:hypothetical protein n=1 Tax=Paenibacillus alginolyticus TaxID=59839 RepID=UPI002283D9E1
MLRSRPQAADWTSIIPSVKSSKVLLRSPKRTSWRQKDSLFDHKLMLREPKWTSIARKVAKC